MPEVNFDQKKFEKNRNVISPITFVGEEFKSDQQLNGLFTVPYDLAVISRATSNSLARDIAKVETIPSEEFKQFAYDVVRMNQENHVDSIRAYLYMNCKDFVFTFLLKMFGDIMTETDEKDPKKRIPKYDYDDVDYDYNYDNGYFMNYSGYLYRKDIDEVITKTIDNFILCTSINDMMPSVYYYQLMNSLYFQLVVYIDSVIKNMVDRRFQVTKFFNKLLENVYGTECMDGTKFRPELRYTFATSIIREMVEKRLPDLYNGLHQIFQVVASMANVGFNPNYMEDMIKLNNIPIGTVNAPINDYFNNNNSCCKEEK